MHRWVVFPAAVDPIDEALESDLFLIACVCPPIMELWIAGFRVEGPCAKQIFQATGNERVALDVKDYVCRIYRG